MVGATGQTGCSSLNIHDPTDGTIGYERESLTSEAFNAVDFVMLNKVLPTDLEVGATSSGGDFIYHDASYSTFCGKNWGIGNTIGLSTCDALKANACDTHNVYLLVDWMAGRPTGDTRKLVCHETGHSIGIPHNDHTGASLDSCMKAQPATSSIAGYSSHEVNDMINFVW